MKSSEGTEIAKRPLIESAEFPVEDLAKLGLREGQRSKSLYRAHRWFARRLGSQFRALLIGSILSETDQDRFWEAYHSDRSSAEDLNVLDPFLGGGTTLVEASRLGATVVGMDIDPVPATISRFHLEAANIGSLEGRLKELQESVGEEIRSYHTTSDNDETQREVLYHFWVQVSECRQCEEELELHPHFQLARDTKEGYQYAFCRHCHQVQKLPLDRKVLVCDDCSRRTTIQAGTLRNGTVHCLNCEAEESLSENSERRNGPPQWRLFANQYLERYGSGPRQVNRVYKRASERDQERYESAVTKLDQITESGEAKIPERPIPTENRSDSRPILHGCEKYSQLFNPRQLLHLHLLAEKLSNYPDDLKTKALKMAFSEHLTTNNMLVGYAFGYERTSPLFSYHSYRHITRPVEVNPWLHRIGRGTFPNAVLKMEKAIEATRKPKDLKLEGGKRESNASVGVGGALSADVSDFPQRSVVASKSAKEIEQLPSNSFDLVLTDPPYGDNINYSELSDFYLSWHQVLGIAPNDYSNPNRHAPLKTNLAASGRQESDLESYRDGLHAIFCQINRVLDQDGRMVFTFHHTDSNTWTALAEALNGSGLKITNVLPLRGEGQGGLHNHSGTIKWDSVFVCRKGTDGVNGDLYVKSEDVNSAKKAAQSWRKRLTKEDLGFGDPDHRNLLRALLSKKAINSSGNGYHLSNKLSEVNV